MPRKHDYSPTTVEAAKILGGQIRVARRERRWTEPELAERVGVTVPTIRRLEAGELGVSVGTAFEAASVLGLSFFSPDPERRALEAARIADRLAILPARSRRPLRIDDDF